MTDQGWWESRWREGRTGWQVAGAHPLLARWWPALGVAAGARVLVPLAGASHDIDWLLARGYRVEAVEFSETAIERYFDQRRWRPQLEEIGGHRAWRYRRLTLLQADFLELDAGLAPCQAVYDRAALIAIDDQRRCDYARTVTRHCAPAARQLLITLEYPPWLRSGPPFSVSGNEIAALYGERFEIRELGQRPEIGLPQREVVYALSARQGTL